MKSVIRNSVIGAALLFVSFSSVALKNDTQQPIKIDAQNQSLDMEKNILTLSDNVVITQGSIRVKANKVIITRPPQGSNQKETVQAFGSPVTFHQMQDNGKPLDGKANQVHYDLATEILTLTGNAELKQQDSKINADKIVYDVKKQKMDARGSNKSRVQTVLIPNQLNQNKK